MDQGESTPFIKTAGPHCTITQLYFGCNIHLPYIYPDRNFHLPYISHWNLYNSQSHCQHGSGAQWIKWQKGNIMKLCWTNRIHINQGLWERAVGVPGAGGEEQKVLTPPSTKPTALLWTINPAGLISYNCDAFSTIQLNLSTRLKPTPHYSVTIAMSQAAPALRIQNSASER